MPVPAQPLHIIRSPLRPVVLILGFLLTVSPAFAQFTSNVRGTVTDPSGSIVSGATVTLTNPATNATYEFTTNSSGQYYFLRLAPGSYTVTVEAPGFGKAIQNATLSTEQTNGVDFRLSVGPTTETVSVGAENTHALNPDETRNQYTLSADEIADFPLQNRATLGLLRVAPGATGISEGQQNIAINRTAASESTNGRSNANNLYLLDFIPLNSQLGGFSNTDTSSGHGSGSITIIPHPDMIAETTLESTTFSVDNTAGTGLAVNFTTKSGANKFHGDGDYTYTGKPFALRGAAQGPLTNFRRQYVSGALGGPIWRDRTFFFGSFFNQQVANAQSSSSNFYAPEFVAWASAHYPNSKGIRYGLVPNPASRALDVQTVTRGSDLDSKCDPTNTSATVLPCTLPVQDLGSFNTASIQNGMQYNGRLDHSLRSGKDRVYVSFFRFDQKSNSPRIQPTLDGNTPSTGYYIAGNYIRQITPSLLNQISFGQTRYNFDYTTTPHSNDLLKLPYLSGCFCAGALASQFLENLTEHQAHGRDSLSYVRGRHNITLGFQGSYNNEASDQSAVYGRPFLMNNFAIYNYLNDITDLELIYTLSGQNGKFIPQLFGAAGTRFGIYGEDGWKITPHLLITYGLRWDDFGNPYAYGPNAEPFSNVLLGQGSTLSQQVAGASSVLVNNVFKSRRNMNFLPRGSFAYNPASFASKLVVRGGIGLYEDELGLNEINNNLPTQPPVRLSLTLSQSSNPVALTSYGTTDLQGPPGGNPYGFQFPTITINGYNAKGAPLDPTGAVIVGDLNGSYVDLKPQKAILYNFGFEQESAANLIFGLTYSGSYGYDQVIQTDVNTYAGLNSTPGAARYNTSFGKIKFFRNDGNSNYNALIATVRQTYKGLHYQASYTFGKALTDPTSNFTDQRNVKSQYSLLSGDVRNRLSIAQAYEVPAHFQKTLLNEALAGWTFNNVLVAQSGTPFTVADTSGTYDFNQDGVFYDIPVYAGTKRNFTRDDARASVLRSVHAFSVSNFIAPPKNSEGGRQNTFHGPGYFSLDTSVIKKFSVPWYKNEQAKLELRAEALNVLNHANFGNPGSEYSNSGTFGIVTGGYQGRIIQIGSRFQF